MTASDGPLLRSAASAPGSLGPIIGEIITDLVTFAVAHAAGRTARARVAFNEARMRMDELDGRVNGKRERRA